MLCFGCDLSVSPEVSCEDGNLILLWWLEVGVFGSWSLLDKLIRVKPNDGSVRRGRGQKIHYQQEHYCQICPLTCTSRILRQNKPLLFIKLICSVISL
jgi:hypothetical protein